MLLGCCGKETKNVASFFMEKWYSDTSLIFMSHLINIHITIVPKSDFFSENLIKKVIFKFA